MEAFAPTTTAAAFYACALVSYDELKKLLAQTDRTSTAGLLLAATVWQCEGDVLRAESALRRAAEGASVDDRPYVVDFLAPLLISRGLFSRAGALIATMDAPHLEIERSALQAVIDAASGALRLSSERAAAIRVALRDVDDDVRRLRIRQRLAFAAYYRADVAQALDEAAEGIRLASLLGADRFACTLHTVAYATHHTSTGDVEATWQHATELTRKAVLGGDASYRAVGRAAVYELAAERGDDAIVERARRNLHAEPLPEQYRERFARGVADTLRLAWAGDFTTCRNVLTVLKDTTGRTDGERALCRAFLALTSLVLGDDDLARRMSRQAISISARPDQRVAAHELRYRRLARALAAVAGELVGDIVRGRRAAEARFLQADADITLLVKLPPDAHLSEVPVTVRGYARFIAAVRERIRARPSNDPLTAMEVSILRLVSVGRNAPQIAVLLDRSPHTVRTHLRNIGSKLDAHGRLEAVSRARQLGLL
ncbi:MAG TPA: LuxR C-terminal-related transcriptional regulator [Candidatus Elarobacter sp.]|nr:LuxR C-terminal-related transcriptional regulator [Candidatus Elarobacter sp.]